MWFVSKWFYNLSSPSWVFKQRTKRHSGSTCRSQIHARKAYIESRQLGNQYEDTDHISPRSPKHQSKSQNLQRSQVEGTSAAPFSIKTKGWNKLQYQDVPGNFKGLRNIRQVLSKYCKQNRHPLKKYLKDIGWRESTANKSNPLALRILRSIGLAYIFTIPKHKLLSANSALQQLDIHALQRPN